jgi:hypothetical protein
MVGTAMQGGCTCENACLLRVDTGNVETAALFAPKPLGMTAADDWTREMPTKGFPELQKHFAMLGAKQNVMLKPLLHFGHNYNYVSRAVMYSWMNKHLKLGLPEPVVEEDYHRLTAAELTVWDAQHPKPAGGPDFERKLLRWITDRDDTMLSGCQDSTDHFRQVYGGAWETILGRNLSTAGSVSRTVSAEFDRGDYWTRVCLLRNETYGEQVPAVFLEPKRAGSHTVIWADGNGKAGLFTSTTGGDDPKPKPAIQKLLARGVTVIGVDLLFQGEFLADGKPITRARKVNNPREAAAYTFGYNHTLFAQRTHDLLSVVQYARKQMPGSQRLDLVGADGAGSWAAAARAVAGSAIDWAAIDTAGFRFVNVADIYAPDFLPGGAKYGDLPGALALAAPGRLWLAGEGEESASLVKKIYQTTGSTANLTLAPAGKPADELAVGWLLVPQK